MKHLESQRFSLNTSTKVVFEENIHWKKFLSFLSYPAF